MRRIAAVLLPFFILACTHAQNLDLSRLKLPPGFHIAIFAQLPHPRMMAFSPGGVLIATDTTEGKIFAFPDPKHSGRPDRVITLADDLNAPHGIAFHSGKLYVAETNAIRRYDWDGVTTAGQPRPGRCADSRRWRPFHSNAAVH